MKLIKTACLNCGKNEHREIYCDSLGSHCFCSCGSTFDVDYKDDKEIINNQKQKQTIRKRNLIIKQLREQKKKLEDRIQGNLEVARSYYSENATKESLSKGLYLMTINYTD